jgi:dUTP pyrophosphatase
MLTKVRITTKNKQMNIKIKRLSALAQMPMYATAGSACFDIATIDHNIDISPGSGAILRTGLSFEIPPGHVMMVYSRSGHGFKNGVRLANGTGVIDSDYRGELMVKLHNDSRATFSVGCGDRIAQAMIVPVQQASFETAETLSDTERGTGGLGSTGT